jgi:DNA-3-methyladenine glycosylase II
MSAKAKKPAKTSITARTAIRAKSATVAGTASVAKSATSPARPKTAAVTPRAARPHVTPDYYLRGRRYLQQKDPKLAEIIKRAGPCRIRAYQGGAAFSALVETIVSQQLSTRVADVIFGRVCALCHDGAVDGADAVTGGNGNGNGLSPERVLALDPTLLRGAGLSGAKVKYVQELAGKVSDGTIVLDDLGALPDEEVTRVLSQVKGIGPWSTHMFLIFRLHRPDIWPIGDLAIVKALQRFHGLRKVPPLKKLEKMGENWRPYRSLAAWYLWASLSLKAED